MYFYSIKYYEKNRLFTVFPREFKLSLAFPCGIYCNAFPDVILQNFHTSAPNPQALTFLVC